MRDEAWKFVTCVVIFAVLAGGVVGYGVGNKIVTMTKDSRDHRAMELEIADVKARLATLERIKIEVELRDKTATWFVYNGRVQ
jgi:uncharacterized protein involved in tellurium resistance